MFSKEDWAHRFFWKESFFLKDKEWILYKEKMKEKVNREIHFSFIFGKIVEIKSIVNNE